MEFIKLEQFKSLDERTQKALLEWWKPKRYDIYIDSSDLSQVECLDYINDNDEGVIYHSMRDNMSIIEDMIPLFTERQLRKFIEDCLDCKIGQINYLEDSNYDIISACYSYMFEDLGNDLLQAYWKVVLEIAKEEIQC